MGGDNVIIPGGKNTDRLGTRNSCLEEKIFPVGKNLLKILKPAIYINTDL
jgi:hypothetical protein